MPGRSAFSSSEKIAVGSVVASALNAIPYLTLIELERLGEIAYFISIGIWAIEGAILLLIYKGSKTGFVVAMIAGLILVSGDLLNFPVIFSAPAGFIVAIDIVISVLIVLSSYRAFVHIRAFSGQTRR